MCNSGVSFEHQAFFNLWEFQKLEQRDDEKKENAETYKNIFFLIIQPSLWNASI